MLGTMTEAAPQAVKSLPLRVMQVGIGLVAVVVVGAELFLTSPPSVLRFEYYGAPVHGSEYAALATDRWETADLTVDQGVVLRGLVRPPRDPDAPWFLYFSGNSPQYLAGAKAFLEAIGDTDDVGLATWAYRGFDGSAGELSPETLRSDAKTMYDHLIRRYRLTSEHIHAVGFSLGTYAAVALAKELAVGTQHLGSVTLLAPFATIDITSPGMLSRWAPADHYDTLSVLEDFRAPMMIIHGESDTVIPLEQAQQLVTALDDASAVLTIPGAGHGDLVTRPAVHDAVRSAIQ